MITFLFCYCFRHSKPRGKKQGPTQTIANGCGAYLSFQFIKHDDRTVAVVRNNPHHTGHDPSNPSEAKKNSMDPELEEFISGRLQLVCCFALVNVIYGT